MRDSQLYTIEALTRVQDQSTCAHCHHWQSGSQLLSCEFVDKIFIANHVHTLAICGRLTSYTQQLYSISVNHSPALMDWMGLSKV